MLNLLTAAQTRAADGFTIKHKPITSTDLMEKASSAFVQMFRQNFINQDVPVSVYCGTGNNGGDGLAIARLLKEQGYERVSVKIVRFNAQSSADFEANLKRLQLTGITVAEIGNDVDFPEENAEILIDALLGSGLNRPLDKGYKMLVEHLNKLQKILVSVDVPTGFPTEGIIDLHSTTIKADLVISFQRPKINFFFPESEGFVKSFRCVDIGLDERFIQLQLSGWKLSEPDDILKIIKPRKAFSHKGTFGHALIIAGSAETMGAALLCADACLHSGAGLTTACIPKEGLAALNSRSPEIMAILRGENVVINIEPDKYQSIAMGPGLGKADNEVKLLKQVIENHSGPLVLDADALNILADHPSLFASLPEKTILTPHVKEFDRLFGQHESWWERIITAKKAAAEHQIIIVLKNRYSFIVLPTGDVMINPTGNPAMAVGGMGDILTGVIAAFLAQGFTAEDSVIAACYIHGRAGDILHEKGGMHCIPPRYLIAELPKTIGSFAV